MTKADEDVVTVGAAFPKVVGVSALAGKDYYVLITWGGGGKPVVVDLGPTIHTFKVYAPLRADRVPFETVHVANRSTIAWGADEAVDMHVSEIERLAAEQTEPFDFAAFMKEMGLTWDSAAALLGMSRRMVGYYASGREVPRTVALACEYLKLRHLMPAIERAQAGNPIRLGSLDGRGVPGCRGGYRRGRGCPDHEVKRRPIWSSA